MEDSPAADASKAGKTHEQKASLAPVSGERPDQGEAPVADYEIPAADHPTKPSHEENAGAPPAHEH
ncbi:MAG: hypothetical protein EOO62_40090, partial [Hymenobacter sp.]